MKHTRKNKKKFYKNKESAPLPTFYTAKESISSPHKRRKLKPTKTNFDLLNDFVKQKYTSQRNFPFLTAFAFSSEDTPFFKGVKILLNVHLTVSTVYLIYTLLLADAELVVTLSEGLIVEVGIIELLKKAGVNFCPYADIRNDFDIVLDCCAGMFGKVTPRLGALELTRTGVPIYSKTKDYPVISIDNSGTKQLETFLGTGDGFVRALFDFLGEEDITNKNIIVLGFGKVGRGIVYNLNLYTKTQISIIEKDKLIPKLREKYPNYNFIPTSQIETIKKALLTTFIFVAATGEKGIVSNMSLTPKDFPEKALLAVMGSEDEFGKNFPQERILYEKKPLNFAADPPTEPEYLDPVWLQWLLCIFPLLSKELANGMNDTPACIDAVVFEDFKNYYGYDDIDLMDIVPNEDKNTNLELSKKNYKRKSDKISSYSLSNNNQNFYNTRSNCKRNAAKKNVIFDINDNCCVELKMELGN